MKLKLQEKLKIIGKRKKCTEKKEYVGNLKERRM